MKKLCSLALFATFQKADVSRMSNYKWSVQGQLDEYFSYHVQKGHYLNTFMDDIQKFKSKIEQTVEECKQNKCKAIWVQLDESQLKLAQTLVDLGFEMHHCTENYLLFSQWLIPAEESRLPNYTTHYVGAGGLIIHNNAMLLVQERNGLRKGMWGLPGGLVDDNELITEAAVREVKEETNLDVEAKDLLMFRELMDSNSNKSDIYFVVMMNLKSAEVAVQKSEIMAHEWVQLDQIDEFMKHNKVGPTQVKVMEVVKEYLSSERYGKQLFDITSGTREYFGKEKKYAIYKPHL